jgi:endonuclease/exonuclease/phosphatase family metal-dependent hydrolase
MPEFPKPTFTYSYNLNSQIEALRHYRRHREGRAIPRKSSDRLLLATWNVANLGAQERRDKDYRLIAELIKWFDMTALQEVKDDLTGLEAIMRLLPNRYHVLFSDAAGNHERLAFVFDSRKVTLLEKVGEVAIPAKDKRYIKLPVTAQKFQGFDRHPYLAAFSAGSFTFVLVNVHLYFGSESAVAMNRRSLEAYAVGRWADLRRKSQNAFSRDIIVLGDFNLPKVEPDDPVYTALTKRGLHLPEHSNRIGSAIASDNQYDQIAFFPGQTQDEFTGSSGVFDFDGALFRNLWDSRGRNDFLAYMRYYISDHRILWAQFRI